MYGSTLFPIKYTLISLGYKDIKTSKPVLNDKKNSKYLDKTSIIRKINLKNLNVSEFTKGFTVFIKV